MGRFSPSPIDPLSQARCVADPAIKDVIDLDAGQEWRVAAFIEQHNYADLVCERGKILSRVQRREARMICSMCHIPVHLICQTDRSGFFFRHIKEDGSCPAKTQSGLSEEQIRARKYHGLRESEPHKRIKALILRSLDADSAFRNTEPEKKLKGKVDPSRFRRPDVQTEHDSGRIVFEVQLSTTFLSVVVGRRDFYRDERALLVWVMGSFDPAYRLMTTDDLLFSNRSNIVVVDEETTRLSVSRGQFHVRCHFRKPVRDEFGVTDSWAEEIVPFSALQQDRQSQQAFYFDFDAAYDELHRIVMAERQAAVEAEIAGDREALFRFWKTHGHGFRHTRENRALWNDLQDRLAQWEIYLPQWPDSDLKFEAMLSTLFSAREGHPVGYKFNKLIQVAHQAAESYPWLLVPFGHVVNINGHSDLLATQDSKGKWRDKLNGKDDTLGIRARMAERDRSLAPDDALLPVLCFLFPEAGEKVKAYIAASSP